MDLLNTHFKALILLVCLLLSACEPPSPINFDQQVYIWQRQWQVAHIEALAQSRATFSALRILALQAHPKEGWITAKVDPQTLIKDGRPLIAVIRLDGQLPQLDEKAIRDKIQQLRINWQALGLPISGIEIDHDCASARLPAYATFLKNLRAELPAALSLSITALPAWLTSPALESVLAQVDHSVLQVHSVNHPALGLFEPKQAEKWAQAYALRSNKPFYLALPAYGMGLIENDDAVPLVESEVPLNTSAPLRELEADPEQVAALIHALESAPPKGLVGLIWFRLPLAGDRRAWPLRTLQAVINHEPLRAKVLLQNLHKGELHQLSLHNAGNISADLPQQFQVIGKNCEAADAIGGYRLQRTATHLIWHRIATTPPRRLSAGQQYAVGWARCETLSQDTASLALILSSAP